MPGSGTKTKYTFLIITVSHMGTEDTKLSLISRDKFKTSSGSYLHVTMANESAAFPSFLEVGKILKLKGRKEMVMERGLEEAGERTLQPSGDLEQGTSFPLRQEGKGL